MRDDEIWLALQWEDAEWSPREVEDYIARLQAQEEDYYDQLATARYAPFDLLD